MLLDTNKDNIDRFAHSLIQIMFFIAFWHKRYERQKIDFQKYYLLLKWDVIA